MGEERKIGMQIGTGNFALASFRVIGQFASAEVIRLNDGGGSHTQMPSLVHINDALDIETARSAKLKLVKMADQIFSPVKMLAEGKEQVENATGNISVQNMISKLVGELREQAGLFGDFSSCSVAYPDYLNSDQLLKLKSAVKVEIPELDDKNFVPASFSVLFDMQLHQARYNLGYHKFDFSLAKKVLVVDIGESFTTASVFEVSEVGQDLEARYLAKPCSAMVGGKDFDTKFTDFLIDQAVLKGNLNENEITPELKRQIQFEAEKYKRDLVEKVDAQVISTHMPPGKMKELTVPMRVFGPSGKKILELEVSKQEYDSAIFSCIASIHEEVPCIFQSVSGVLNLAGLTPNEIDEVVLVGGMARVHIIGQVMKHIFGKVPREFVNPELAAVRGASIYQDIASSPLEMRF